MRQLGLIGYPLGHSFSAKYFGEKFAREGIKADYRLYEIASAELRQERRILLPRLLKRLLKAA